VRGRGLGARQWTNCVPLLCRSAIGLKELLREQACALMLFLMFACVCARALCCCSDQLLGCVNVELAKMGQAPVNDVEQAAFMAFAKSVYHPSVDTPSSAISDVSAFSLAGLSAVLAGGS
jgi:hypothetical protein